MRRARALCASCVMLVSLASHLSAQSLPSQFAPVLFEESLSPEQNRELDEWLSQMDDWRRYETKHQNRPARNAFGRIVPRRSPPQAPAWLAHYCASAARAGIVDLEPRTTKGCRTLKDQERDSDPAAVAQRAARAAGEKIDKYSSFLRRLHVDGLGMTTSSGPRLYGIIGSHITLVDAGRVQIFGPPGVLLLSVPDVGGRRLTLGYTWGVSVRLVDVRLFGASPNTTLFMTVSKLWVNGSRTADSGVGGLQIVSLSLAPRKKR